MINTAGGQTAEESVPMDIYDQIYEACGGGPGVWPVSSCSCNMAVPFIIA